MAMLMIQMRYNTERNVFLFDTFEGMPEPTKEDGAKEIQEVKDKKQRKHDLTCTLLQSISWSMVR